MAGLPPPPINDQPGSFTWLEWYRQLRNYVSTSGSVPWYIINFSGSNITDIALRDHNNMQNTQGGSAGEKYHVTQAQNDIINKMTWNDADGTINLAMNDTGVVSQQIGLETYYRVMNQSGATLTNGKAIMAVGAVGASGRIKADYAIGDGSVSSQYILGVATEDIVNGEEGYITNFGQVRGIDTTGSPYGETWADGDILYVSASTAGALTNIAPTAPNLKMPIAMVLTAHTNGTIYVRPTFDHTVDDLSNTNITSVADKQFLRYNSSTGVWENKDVATPTGGAGLTLKTTEYLSIDIGGTTYKIALVN